MKNIFGKYWIIQILIISTLILYSVIATMSILFLVENNGFLINSTNNNGTNDTDIVSVTLIFKSNVKEIPISWDTIVLDIDINSTLYKFMNDNLNLTITDFGYSGVIINGINNILSDSTNFWTYEYYFMDSGWIRAPIGVSNFILDSSYIFKWTYGPSGF